MHPTARRCVWGAVVLWVAGAALIGLAPTLYDLADGWLGGVVDVGVGFLQEAMVPTGAALVGAAIVIQALRGTRPSSVADVAPGAQASPATGAVPTAGPPSATPPTPPAAPPLSGAMPSVPESSPVLAVPPPSGPVPMTDLAPENPENPENTAAPVPAETGATAVAPKEPARAGRQPRYRREG